jgi:hypothetical protein
VGNSLASGERMQIRAFDEDPWPAALLEFDPDGVVSAERKGCRRVAPSQLSGTQFAFSAADRIAAKIDELLPCSQRPSLAHTHR